MDHMIAQELASKVATSILRADRSRRFVAAAVDIPATTFKRKIDGHVELTMGELIRIAQVLEVTTASSTPVGFLDRFAA